MVLQFITARRRSNAGGAVALEVTHQQTRTDTGNQGTTGSYSFGSVPFGDADDTRLIVAGAVGTGGAVTGMTIAGVSATEIANVGGSTDGTALYVAAIPSGTSGTITVHVNTTGGCVMWAYRVVNAASATPHDSDGVTGGASISLDIPASGVAIGIVRAGSNSDVVWTGLTEDTDFSFADGIGGGSTVHFSSASDFFDTIQTGRTVSTSSSARLVAASWGG